MKKTKGSTDKLDRYLCCRPVDVCLQRNRSGQHTGHYGRVQQRGTKETNNGLMKGDGVTKHMRTTGQLKARGQLQNAQPCEKEAKKQ